ncbi:AAA family ATPase [Clostridium chromiireducens]|uniref:AAA family ATPase n=1 Tax=Clostridium chromiireducens TaxID=225345 RepID=A0A964RRS4_9CLOT|nr:AAA-like domain-containing protein [Clostridium chromiireducens]MVX66540.1 AAA family ATPase [Clostridium chromiireducens]
MEKEFNITGTCIPNMHYMVDITSKLSDTINLINKGKYFIINRPRQYGKTTTLYLLNKQLKNNEEYLPIKISFEGIGDVVFEDEESFSKTFLKIISKNLSLKDEKLSLFLDEERDTVKDLSDLSSVITKLITKADKKVVIMIDEVDKSSNNQLFLSFLGMLRNKYLLRNEGEDITFHSVILAGVHDIKSLKLRIRPDDDHKYNSPWNIASDFDVDMSFSVDEIGTMLDDYVQNKGVNLDKSYFSEKLYFYTSGYPFLVSKLCKIIDEKIMIETKLKWEEAYMDMAVKLLLTESNTNFDSLIKNIENNKELKELVKKIILDGYEITYNQDNFIITIAIMYGIFKNNAGKVKIHNRIYEQRIYNYMSSLIETASNLGFYNERAKFINANGDLNIKKILIKFKEFMKHEYSERREAFLEDDGRLVFLAFISPIINGTGFAFKEVKGGDEKRFDIVITYNKNMYIIELKIWRGEEYHKKGLIQLGEYLEQYSLSEGYLLIFDFRKTENVSGEMSVIDVEVSGNSKEITEVYC